MSFRDTILYDSLFQAVVLGPVAGLLFGIALARWFPNLTRSSESPRERDTKIIMMIRQEVHHYHGTRQRYPSPPPSVRPTVLVLSFVATWLFVRYLETITYIFWFGLGFVAALIVGFFATVFIRRGVNRAWLFELLVFALVPLGVCFWLVSLPWDGIDPAVVDAANEANSFVQFYQNLSPWDRKLVNAQMAGMWLVAVTAFVILLRGLHILALAMADPENPYGLSVRIAFATRYYGGLRGIALILLPGTLALYMLVATQNPDALIWRMFGGRGT